MGDTADRHAPGKKVPALRWKRALDGRYWMGYDVGSASLVGRSWRFAAPVRSARFQAPRVDDRALVPALADRPALVMRDDLEHVELAFAPEKPRLGGDARARQRRSRMLDVDRDA